MSESGWMNLKQPLVQTGLAKDAFFQTDADGVHINVMPGPGPHLSGPTDFPNRRNNLPSSGLALSGPMLVRLNNYQSHAVAEIRYWWRNSGKMPNNILYHIHFYGAGGVKLGTFHAGKLAMRRDSSTFYQLCSHHLGTFVEPEYGVGSWSGNTPDFALFQTATEAELVIEGGQWS